MGAEEVAAPPGGAAPATPPPARLGPLWRLPLFLLALVVAQVAAEVVAVALWGRPPDLASPASYTSAGILRWWASVLPSVLAIDLSYRGLVHALERRSPRELKGPHLLPELVLGFLLGAFLLSAIVGGLALAGCFAVTGVRSASASLPALAVSFGSGYGEEVLLRGALLRLLDEALGSRAALAISALLFGLLHLLNPHATVLSVASITMAGLLLGAAYLLTRRLWFAIGVHVAWNYAQGGVFGIAVSGHPIGGWLVGRLRCADAWSGGAFGVEGSVWAVLLCGLAAAVLLGVAARYGRLRSAPRRGASA
jgi:membrane protease YdiL (CAAX protease family)